MIRIFAEYTYHPAVPWWKMLVVRVLGKKIVTTEGAARITTRWWRDVGYVTAIDVAQKGERDE